MNTETPTQKFECYAIVEIMGHGVMAGHVVEQTFGSAVFLRITVPKTKHQESFDRLLHPNSIFAINPCTEAVAKARAEQINYEPITPWDQRQMLKDEYTQMYKDELAKAGIDQKRLAANSADNGHDYEQTKYDEDKYDGQLASERLAQNNRRYTLDEARKILREEDENYGADFSPDDDEDDDKTTYDHTSMQ